MSRANVNLSKPFYAYIKDRARSTASKTYVYHSEPLLVFASYVNASGVSFMFERDGQIREINAKDVLFSHLEGETNTRYLVRFSGSNEYKMLTRLQVKEFKLGDDEILESIDNNRRLKAIDKKEVEEALKTTKKTTKKKDTKK